MSAPRKRVLFVSENVTLAQVVRLVTLARSLDARRYEVHFACSRFDPLCFAGTNFVQHELYTIDARDVEKALERGGQLYGTRLLERYVEADLALLSRVKPALVVSDFRLSLPISAPVFGVKHAAFINAYWSPFAVRDAFPMPDHPIVRLLGEELAGRYFPKAMPSVFRHFAKPVNTLRKKHGLPPIGDLLDVLTFGDYTLYPDIPELTPLRGAPSQHLLLGPVQWAPDQPLPDSWQAARRTDALTPIYVTLGSSGNVRALPHVVRALAPLPVRVLLATAGRAHPTNLPSNFHVTDFVPGDEAARRSALVITNGGSSTGYQALAEGTPVLGIASNLDQYLAMTSIAAAGAGILVRAGNVTAEKVASAVHALLTNPDYAIAAQRIALAMKQLDCVTEFRRFVDHATDVSAQPRFAPALTS